MAGSIYIQCRIAEFVRPHIPPSHWWNFKNLRRKVHAWRVHTGVRHLVGCMADVRLSLNFRWIATAKIKWRAQLWPSDPSHAARLWWSMNLASLPLSIHIFLLSSSFLIPHHHFSHILHLVAAFWSWPPVTFVNYWGDIMPRAYSWSADLIPIRCQATSD